jgi:stage II sporulation protein M
MAKKRGKFNLRKEYRECWKYIRESKKFIYIILGIFFVFALVGFLVPAPDYLVEQIMELFEDIIAKTEGLSHFGLIKFIFVNNLQSSFFGIIFGIVFGVFPVFGAISNGYVLGFVSEMSSSNFGFVSLLSLLPHGIFELPAIFISLAMGLKLSSFVFQKDKKKFVKEDMLKILKVFLLIVVPLLIIAAIIEGSFIALR